MLLNGLLVVLHWLRVLVTLLHLVLSLGLLSSFESFLFRSHLELMLSVGRSLVLVTRPSLLIDRLNVRSLLLLSSFLLHMHILSVLLLLVVLGSLVGYLACFLSKLVLDVLVVDLHVRVSVVVLAWRQGFLLHLLAPLHSLVILLTRNLRDEFVGKRAGEGSFLFALYSQFQVVNVNI